MSAIFKTQGGSGGFFPSIFVTGLLETDTAYATMGSKTVYGKWETRTVDETEVSGFLISPLREFGTWTVTATDGEKTKTADVLVDVATEFEIEIDLYKLWLYREGEENESIGLTVVSHPTYGSGATVKGEDYYKFGATETGKMSGAALFSNVSLDLTPYNTLKLKAKHTAKASTETTVDFGISSTGADHYSANGSITFTERVYLPLTSSTTVEEYTADISDITSGYVVVNAWGSICEMYELWLEE